MSKKINKLHFYAQKILPLTYDNSLSYMEWLGKVVATVNEIIEEVENFVEETQTLVNTFDARLTNDESIIEWHTSAIGGFNETFTRVFEEITTLKSRTSLLETSTQNLRTDLTDLSQSTNARFNNINEFLTTLTQQIGGIVAQITSIETVIDGLEGDVTRIDGTIDSITTEFREGIYNINQFLTTLTQQIAGITQQITSIETVVEGLEDDVTRIDGDITSLENDVSSLSQTVTAHGTQIAEHHDEILWLTNDAYAQQRYANDNIAGAGFKNLANIRDYANLQIGADPTWASRTVNGVTVEYIGGGTYEVSGSSTGQTIIPLYLFGIDSVTEGCKLNGIPSGIDSRVMLTIRQPQASGYDDYVGTAHSSGVVGELPTNVSGVYQVALQIPSYVSFSETWEVNVMILNKNFPSGTDIEKYKYEPYVYSLNDMMDNYYSNYESIEELYDGVDGLQSDVTDLQNEPKLPTVTGSDEGKILAVDNGVPKWVEDNDIIKLTSSVDFDTIGSAIYMPVISATLSSDVIAKIRGLSEKRKKVIIHVATTNTSGSQQVRDLYFEFNGALSEIRQVYVDYTASTMRQFYSSSAGAYVFVAYLAKLSFNSDYTSGSLAVFNKQL